MTDTILHAGFHKTGSTFLQHDVFRLIADIQYVTDFDEAAPALTEANAQLPILYSHEAACGSPYPIAEPFSVDQLAAQFIRLHVTKVILVVREFHGWVLSLYFQTLNEGSHWTLEQFIRTNRRNLLGWQEAVPQIAELCRKRGVELLVIEHESLKREPQRACDDITDFLGCSRIRLSNVHQWNVSYFGVLTITTYRWLNRLGMKGNVSRRLVQERRLGKLLDWLSSRRLSGEDVRRLFATLDRRGVT